MFAKTTQISLFCRVYKQNHVLYPISLNLANEDGSSVTGVRSLQRPEPHIEWNLEYWSRGGQKRVVNMPLCYLENTGIATEFQVVHCAPIDPFASRDNMVHA